LFQHTLARVSRTHLQDLYNEPLSPPTSSLSWTGIPLIHDEVFTGLYRLGHFTSSSLIATDPDISVHAKLLTGGLLPLCTTLASESIFNAFLSEEKSDALLHGHSYTAHAVGCEVARYSVDAMRDMDAGETWKPFKRDWTGSNSSVSSAGGLWCMWSHDFVATLSKHASVDSVFALGSVLAVSLRDDKGGGYTSTAAVGLRDQLIKVKEAEGDLIHSRVLGNVLYLMASMTSTKESLSSVEEVVKKALGV